MHRFVRAAHLVFSLTLCAVACTGHTTSPAADPADRDVSAPFPIDVVSSAAPSTYKGLPLTLTMQSAPTVTPVDGVIGVVCIGMSNANQECARLLAAVGGGGPWSADVSPAVRLVNCAVGGHAIERWNDAAFDATLWDSCINAKLSARGVRRDQVRVVLHKAANQFGLGPGGVALPRFPAAAANFAAFERNLSVFAARVKPAFLNVQAVYTSSRSYGGYTPRPERGEPQTYEEGHALNRWLATNPVVDGVWHGW